MTMRLCRRASRDDTFASSFRASVSIQVNSQLPTPNVQVTPNSQFPSPTNEVRLPFARRSSHLDDALRSPVDGAAQIVTPVAESQDRHRATSKAVAISRAKPARRLPGIGRVEQRVP